MCQKYHVSFKDTYVHKWWKCKDVHTNEKPQGTSLEVQWLRLHAPNAGGPGSIPGQGTRFHVPQFKRRSHGVGSLSPSPGIEPGVSCIAGGFFTSWATREAWVFMKGFPILLCAWSISRGKWKKAATFMHMSCVLPKMLSQGSKEGSFSPPSPSNLFCKFWTQKWGSHCLVRNNNMDKIKSSLAGCGLSQEHHSSTLRQLALLSPFHRCSNWGSERKQLAKVPPLWSAGSSRLELVTQGFPDRKAQSVGVKRVPSGDTHTSSQLCGFRQPHQSAPQFLHLKKWPN